MTDRIDLEAFDALCAAAPTLYLFDHGDCHSYDREESGGFRVNYRDDMPESFAEDFEDSVFMVFVGTVHTDTLNASEEQLDARGIPSQAAQYDEWWEGSMRRATDAELLAVFGDGALIAELRAARAKLPPAYSQYVICSPEFVDELSRARSRPVTLEIVKREDGELAFIAHVVD